ncbi:MAG: hypothetical protein CM15mP74_27580 [Halieaceae bacterium]|nr:MAG: hypothetical protein CM15mP74_27580 [Halieaceae bacterium]
MERQLPQPFFSSEERIASTPPSLTCAMAAKHQRRQIRDGQ